MLETSEDASSSMNVDNKFSSHFAPELNEIEIGNFNNRDENATTFVDTSEPKYSGVFEGRGGSTCSNFLAENLLAFLSPIDLEEDTETKVVTGFKSCDDSFYSKHPSDNSGSSAIVAFIDKLSIFLAWSGNSRAVLMYNNNVKQLTTPHSPLNANERHRIVSHGGLIVQGQIMGVLDTSRGFGDNDIKRNVNEGVLISEPDTFRLTLDENLVASSKFCFLILATAPVWDMYTNEAACKAVSTALMQGGNNPKIAAKALAEGAVKKGAKNGVTVSVITWGKTSASSWRSRSSSNASWRSWRSFSNVDELISKPF